MTPQEFTRRHEKDWERFSQILAKGQSEWQADFPRRYREVCTHLALARDRQYPLPLVERLNLLALEGQQRLYRHQGGLWRACLDFAAGGFPALVRRHWRMFWIAALVFYVPAFLVIAAIWWHPELVYSIIPPEKLAEYEQMYEPGGKVIGAVRGNDTNLMMFGFYVRNNTGIGFQTFAGGLFGGVGSLFFLLFNAIQIGAVTGHLTRIGYGHTLLPFMATHGAFELTAIVLSGMAGLMLGLALIAPGQQTRRDALLTRGREAVRIIYGAAAMFIIAAVIEGFWSSSAAIPANVKYSVAAVVWLFVIAYFLFAGRRST